MVKVANNNQPGEASCSGTKKRQDFSKKKYSRVQIDAALNEAKV
jgi:hypothetical protein